MNKNHDKENLTLGFKGAIPEIVKSCDDQFAITGGDVPRRGRFELVKSIAFICLLLIVANTMVGCSLEMASTRGVSGSENMESSPANAESSASGYLSVSADSLNQESVIRSGDKVQLTVWGYPKFNATTTVNKYGMVSVPLVGDMIVAGLTVRQLSSELKQRLSEYVKGNVKLSVSHVGVNEEVSVLGAVGKPGNYPALADRSLVVLLADAGGTTTNANLNAIKIYRHGIHSSEICVNLTQYLRNGNVQYVPRVGPGDVVYVSERPNFIRDFSTYASEVVFLFGFFALLR